MTKMQTAVLYGRYSPSSRQREKDVSIEQQFKECHEYCAREGIRIIGEYEDHGITGTNDRRADFQRMIADSGHGKFDTVVVWKLNRFARSREDSAIYKGILRRNGVRVISIKERIPDGPEGILLEGNLETYAEFFSRQLAQDIKRGLYSNAKECKVNGLLPFGYKRGEDGRAAINEITAPHLIKAYGDYADWVPAKEILEELKAKGLVTASGRQFTYASLLALFRNERYKGIYIYGDVRIEGGMPRLISDELWNKVQIIADKHRIAPAASRGMDYPLTGKLYCKNCDKAYVGMSARGRHGGLYYYYRCSGTVHDKTCPARAIPKDKIEIAIARILMHEVLTTPVIAWIADRAIEEASKAKDNKNEITRLRRELSECKKRRNNISEAIQQGVITRTTKDDLLALENREDELQTLLEREEIKKPDITRREIVYWLERFANGDIENDDFRNLLFEKFVMKAFIDGGDEVTIAIPYAENEEGGNITSDIAAAADETTDGGVRLWPTWWRQLDSNKTRAVFCHSAQFREIQNVYFATIFGIGFHHNSTTFKFLLSVCYHFRTLVSIT